MGGAILYALYTFCTLYNFYTLLYTQGTREKGKNGPPFFWSRIPLGIQTTRMNARTKNETKRNDLPLGLTRQSPILGLPSLRRAPACLGGLGTGLALRGTCWVILGLLSPSRIAGPLTGPLTQATGPPRSDAGVGIGMLRGNPVLSAN